MHNTTFTRAEAERWYHLRASGPLVAKPGVDLALRDRGLIEQYNTPSCRMCHMWFAYEVSDKGLRMLEEWEQRGGWLSLVQISLRINNTVTVFPEQLPALKEDDYYEWRIDDGDERYFCRRDCATKIWTYEVGFEDEDNDEGWTYEPISYADLPATVKATKLYTIVTGKNSAGSWSLVRLG